MKKTIIRLLSLAAVLLGTICFAGTTAKAETLVDDSNHWEYIVDSENRIILTNYLQIFSDADWNAYEVLVPSAIKINGEYKKVYGTKGTFKGHTKIHSVRIEYEIKSIGEDTFSGCTNLYTASICETVVEIGDNAFNGCTNLQSVELQNQYPLTTIGNYAFSGCSKLEEITIPDAVTHFGNAAFSGCVALKKVKMTENSKLATTYGNTFNGCKSLTAFTIPAGMKEISAGMFEGCSSLKTVTVADEKAIKSIGASAFENCGALEDFTIPSGVTSIGKEAFYQCASLKSVAFPAGLTSIGEGAFYKCTALQSADMDSCTSDGVRLGGYSVFDGEVFYGCKNLTSATVIKFASQILEDCFYDCEKLNNVEIHAKTIGSDAFYHCRQLSNLTLKDGIESIGYTAFGGCSSLTGIILPATVKEMDDNPFYDCDNIRNIMVSNKNIVYDSRDNCNAVIETETDRLVIGCTNTEIPDSVKILGTYCFAYNDDLDTVQFASEASQLNKIEHGAFYCCSNLTNLTIPAGVKTIEGDPFYYCERLPNVVLPDGMTKLGSRFDNCTSMTKLRFPWGLSMIYGVADTVSMERITIPSTATCLSSLFISGCDPEICYQGTKEMWDKIEILGNNDALEAKEIHFVDGDIDIKKAAVQLDRDSYAYTGSQVIPEVTLTYAGLPLAIGREYTLEYKDNVQNGYGKIVITGKGSFTGTTEKTFTIGTPGEQGGEKDPKTQDPSGGKDPQGPAGTQEAKPATKGTVLKGSDAAVKNLVIASASDDAKSPEAEVKKAASKKSKTITIPDSVTDEQGVTYKVTKIGKKAFSGCKKAKTVIIRAKSLKSIGKGAFKGLKKNAKIYIYAKNKKEFTRIKNLIKKSKPGKVKYIFKKG